MALLGLIAMAENCPKCGRDAERRGPHEHKGDPTKQFYTWDHEPDALVTSDYCTEVIDK